MKSVISIWIAGLLAVGSVSGDIIIELQNNSNPVFQPGGGFVDQVLVQLIWTETVPAPKAGIGGAVGAGEILLSSLVTTSGFGGVWPFQPQGTVTYTDVDVGNKDINSGYIIVRLFDSTALGWGDYYLQQAQEGTPLDEPPTVYNTEAGILGGALDSQGYAIIPEPAVASLVVVFGGGMLISRRIFRKPPDVS